MNRLPRGARMRKVHTKRYNKQVPGHHIQMDVKFLAFKGKRGEKIRRFQYTAIDDAMRVRSLKVYEKHTQANAIDFVDHVIEKSPSAFARYEPATAMSSRRSSIGASKTKVFGTLISNVEHPSSTAKLSAHTDPTGRNFISFLATMRIPMKAATCSDPKRPLWPRFE